jgi:hypothetical protein
MMRYNCRDLEFRQKQYDAETQWVTQVAKSIKDENPDVDISWTECICLAEKYLRENKS